MGAANAFALLCFLPANAAQKNMTMFLLPRLRSFVGLPAVLRGPWVLAVRAANIFARVIRALGKQTSTFERGHFLACTGTCRSPLALSSLRRGRAAVQTRAARQTRFRSPPLSKITRLRQKAVVPPSAALTAFHGLLPRRGLCSSTKVGGEPAAAAALHDITVPAACDCRGRKQ